jgi:histidine phosphotransferase ChpT
MLVDLRVLELLSSKICHDLVSPVSAINNGVELIEDIGGSVVDEAMKLIGASAGHASRRLRLFRFAYGRAGNQENVGLKEVRQTVEQYFAGGKIALNWPETILSDSFIERVGTLKTLVNLFIMGEEILAYGGTLTLKTNAEEGPLSCAIEIVGRNAHLSPSFQAALEGTVPAEELTPRTIQSYMTGRFASSFGLKISWVVPGDDRLDFHLSALPA